MPIAGTAVQDPPRLREDVPAEENAVIRTGSKVYTFGEMSASTITTYTDTAWNTWVTDNTAATSTEIWTNWITVNDSTSEISVCDNEPYYAGAGNHLRFGTPPTPPTPAETQRRRVEDMQRRRARVPAEAKAEELLKKLLTPEQWRDWERYESIRHVGRLGIYEIGTGWSGMIYMLDANGEPIKKLCIHPPSRFPRGDRVAAVLLHLMANEEEVVRRANTHSWTQNEKERVKLRRAHRLRVAA